MTGAATLVFAAITAVVKKRGYGMRWFIGSVLALAATMAHAQACFNTAVSAPAPLMGNHGEMFRISDGSVYEVVGSYEYLYAYYPQVTICPGAGKMLVGDKRIGIQPVKGAARKNSGSSSAPNAVVLRVPSCAFFIADGPRGYYLAEWYGGYDPEKGDGIFGDLGGYGFKDVFYANGREGRLYIDDYLLSKESAIEKIRDKCH